MEETFINLGELKLQLQDLRDLINDKASHISDDVKDELDEAFLVIDNLLSGADFGKERYWLWKSFGEFLLENNGTDSRMKEYVALGFRENTGFDTDDVDEIYAGYPVLLKKDDLLDVCQWISYQASEYDTDIISKDVQNFTEQLKLLYDIS